MSKNGKVKVGIIGSQFQADIHVASFKIASEEAEVVAVASPTPGNAAALAKRYGIPRIFTDYREMLKERDIEMITIAAPNRLHAQMTADCAQAGKHVVCEKPLAMTIEQCEQMIHDTRQSGVLLLYAEELFFTPKYLKAKEWPTTVPSEKSIWSSKVKNTSDLTAHGSGMWTSAGVALSWIWAVTGLRFAIGSWDVPRSSPCTAKWGRTFTPTKPRPRTKLIASWNLRAEPWALLKTVGDGVAAWTTGSRSTAQKA